MVVGSTGGPEIIVVASNPETGIFLKTRSLILVKLLAILDQCRDTGSILLTGHAVTIFIGCSILEYRIRLDHLVGENFDPVPGVDVGSSSHKVGSDEEELLLVHLSEPVVGVGDGDEVGISSS